jgi:O-antigen/teichoic acid export membrane protein
MSALSSPQPPAVAQNAVAGGHLEMAADLASGSLLARSTIWNLIGYAAPLLVAVVVIPYLIRRLGTAEYGVLTIAWGIVGYFGVFDMGLSNAVTKFVAERIGRDAPGEINDIFHTGLALLLGSSVCGALLLVLLARPLAYSWLSVPPDLRGQTCTVFRLFALALPFVVSVACFRGTLGAYQRFDVINKIQIAVGSVSFAGPALVALFSRNLIPIVAFLVASRAVTWLIYLYCCFQVMPALSTRFRPRRKMIRPLVTFGGWISICNLLDPIFLCSDRFMLGAVVSMNAVAYYATPFDMVVRLWLIPDALNTALFPAYASSMKRDGRRATELLEKAGHYLFPLIFAPVLLVILFARQILTLWISASFAAHSAIVLQWLAVGVLLSSLARVPWTVLVAHRPDLPAKLVLFEAPVYLALLYGFIRLYGLEGAAMAWTGRCAFNCAVLHAMTWRALTDSYRAIKKNGAMLAIGLLTLAGTVMLPGAIGARALYLALALAVAVGITWFGVMSAEERRELVPASHFSRGLRARPAQPRTVN